MRPFEVQVRPTDTGSGIGQVLFYLDDNLICTDATPDADGVYSCQLEITDCDIDGELRVVATDNRANSAELTRTLSFTDSVCLVNTGNSAIINAIIGVIIISISALTYVTATVKIKE